MKTKLISLLFIGAVLLGAVGMVSAYGYESILPGIITPGYYTSAVYNPETITTTPWFYTPMVYMPNADADGDEMEEAFCELILPGTVTPGFHTQGSYDPQTGTNTLGFYTPAIYTPDGESPLVYTSGVPPPEQNVPESGGNIPDIEDRRMEVEEVPEAYSLREDLPGTEMPGPRRLVP